MSKKYLRINQAFKKVQNAHSNGVAEEQKQKEKKREYNKNKEREKNTIRFFDNETLAVAHATQSSVFSFTLTRDGLECHQLWLTRRWYSFDIETFIGTDIPVSQEQDIQWFQFRGASRDKQLKKNLVLSEREYVLYNNTLFVYSVFSFNQAN